MENTVETTYSELDDVRVREMLQVAERLREANGGVLDDAAIQAVSDATGAPVDYVRIATQLIPHAKRRSVFSQFRSAVFQIEPDTRRSVLSALAGVFAAAGFVLAILNEKNAGQDFYTTLELIAIGAGVWNVSLSRDTRVAAMAGSVGTGTFFVAQSLFAYMGNAGTRMEAALLPVFLILGALVGVGMQRIVKRNRGKLGISDPLEERQLLLKQLVDLQDKLRSGEQSITFLSVDIVGSTQLKSVSDPLSVEFTFNEYHRFVETVAKRFGGRVHSTAGDGCTLAFESPQQAFLAGRNLQTGLIELNTFRNKLPAPIALRVGIHTGSVVAPQAGDITSLNFAHVIDMAAHIQKECPVGCVAISEAASHLIPGGATAVGAQRIRVHDTSAVVWAPKSAVSGLPAGPAALPETS